MKDEMYAVINKIFDEFVVGQNKDGVYVVVDGQQYNIKIVAKKKPVLFEGQSEFVQTDAPAIKIIDWNEEKQKIVEELFKGLIDDV